jgi:putative membrane protein
MTAANILPHITASLNAVALCFLVAGLVLIRTGRRDLHKRAMLGAVVTSALFLAVYVVYHFAAPIFVFRGTGLIRPVYYVLLISHVILAALVTPMIVLTLVRALRGDFFRHKKIARWTLPIWLYVSVTGIVVYVMLYRINWPA